MKTAAKTHWHSTFHTLFVQLFTVVSLVAEQQQVLFI